MLNLYNYYDNVKSLPLYSELSSHLPLLDNHEEWEPQDAKTLEPIKHIIKQSPANAYYYALNVIKGRWPEAEPWIMKAPYYAYKYAQLFIKGRWPEAEPYIIKNISIANMYVKNIIKERCPEIEHRLAGTTASLYYVNDILGGNWGEFDNGKYVKDAWYNQDILITLKVAYESLKNDDEYTVETAIHPKLEGNIVNLYDDNNEHIGQIIKSGYKLSFLTTSGSQFAVAEDYRITDTLLDHMYEFISWILEC